MVKMSMNFNPKDLEKELERRARQAVEQEVKKNPSRFLDDKAGEVFAGACPTCGKAEVKILKGGKGVCQKCGKTMTISADLNWR